MVTLHVPAIRVNAKYAISHFDDKMQSNVPIILRPDREKLQADQIKAGILLVEARMARRI